MIRWISKISAFILIGVSICLTFLTIKKIKEYNKITDCIYYTSLTNNRLDKIDWALRLSSVESRKRDWNDLKLDLIIKTNEKIKIVHPLIFDSSDSLIYRINKLYKLIDKKLNSKTIEIDEQILQKKSARFCLEFLRFEHRQINCAKSVKVNFIKLGFFSLVVFGLGLTILFRITSNKK